jgi:hypothetical protein
MQMDTQPDKHTMRTDRQAKSPAAMVWDLVFAALINPKYRQTGSDYLGTSLVLGIWLLVLEMWEQPYSVYLYRRVVCVYARLYPFLRSYGCCFANSFGGSLEAQRKLQSRFSGASNTE